MRELRCRACPDLEIFDESVCVAHVTRLDAAYEYIYGKLVRGELEPGRKLSRRKLAGEIGVSPALVQHALNQLEKAGLVECRPQSGTYVRTLTAEEFDNLCDLRELIEPYAAARAAERITESQLEILADSCRRYAALQIRISPEASPRELWQLHSEIIDVERLFHGTILQAAGNPLVASLAQSLRVLAHVRQDFVLNSVTRSGHQATLDEHGQILAALQARAADQARQHMLEHLQNGREAFKQRLLLETNG